VGKRKRGSENEGPEKDGALERLLQNRPLAYVLGAAVVAAFAGLAILVVTLLGGDEIGTRPQAASVPAPIGPPVYVRSDAADLLESKTWDEMSAGERSLVEAEIRRVFDNSTFRASSGFVLASDVARVDGDTLVSRQYQPIETPGNVPALAERILVYCNEPKAAYRYIISPLQADFAETSTAQSPKAWGTSLSGADFSQVRDLGFKESERTGRRLHGLELAFKIDPSVAQARPAQYWFDVETAQLAERGSITENDEASTQANWYYLQYDELPPITIPDSLEQPDCVRDILERVPL
jgi:hypothetical protein